MSAYRDDQDVQRMLAFKEGDEESFARLVEAYERPLINFAYRFSANQAAAEDIAQDVFLKVYTGASSYKPSARFSTWLFSIASNACIDIERKRKLSTVSLSAPAGPGTEPAIREYADTRDPSPHHIIEAQDTVSRVQQALSSLPAGQRLAIILKVYEERSYREIADILRVSIASVESLLFRARERLKAELKDTQ